MFAGSVSRLHPPALTLSPQGRADASVACMLRESDRASASPGHAEYSGTAQRACGSPQWLGAAILNRCDWPNPSIFLTNTVSSCVNPAHAHTHACTGTRARARSCRRKRCSQRCLRTHTCAGMRTNACSHTHAHAMSRQQHGMLAEARSHARTRGHGSTCSRRFTHARTDTHASTQARTRARAHEVCRHVRIKFACARTHAHTRAHTPQRSTVRMLRDWYRHDRGHRKRARAVHLETDQRIRREVTFPT